MKFQEALEILSSIASRFPEDSKEQQAIELWAYGLAIGSRLLSAFAW